MYSNKPFVSSAYDNYCAVVNHSAPYLQRAPATATARYRSCLDGLDIAMWMVFSMKIGYGRFNNGPEKKKKTKKFTFYYPIISTGKRFFLFFFFLENRPRHNRL